MRPPIAPASRRASAWTSPRPLAAPDTITTFPERLNSGRREAVTSVAVDGGCCEEEGGGVTEERGFWAENLRVSAGVDVFNKKVGDGRRVSILRERERLSGGILDIWVGVIRGPWLWGEAELIVILASFESRKFVGKELAIFDFLPSFPAFRGSCDFFYCGLR